MSDFCHQVRQLYGEKRVGFLEELYKMVNRQALGPFFRPHITGEGRILDAGSGSGHLAEEVGLGKASFLDITWKEIKAFRDKRKPGFFIQGDLRELPFKEDVFDQVICSNVLHYTGPCGMEELFRVTKNGGQMLVAFLEGSGFTRCAVNLAILWGLFPPLMRNARFIDLNALVKLDIQIEDSATVGFIPPRFRGFRNLPLRGLVALVLKKRVSEQIPKITNTKGSGARAQGSRFVQERTRRAS